ncbi:hypothetical protein WKW77_34580 [Variovorax ureilyticus]|uniref:ATP-cone domain-containing protein n=1 Tax=Variovorax ureilyticus TaxID=1836198 RepID=A0ABU8VRB5_9BURK
MLIWNDGSDVDVDAAAASPLKNYMVVRRSGSVVPFEPSAIEEAMWKVLCALRGSMEHRYRSFAEGVLEAVQFQCKCQLVAGFAGVLRLLFNHGIQARRLARRTRPVPGVSQGFFSAVKPNLRNAP